eukprot:COSAG04_NODE_618_length_11896_cov_81.925659_13_plen_37_part_00
MSQSLLIDESVRVSPMPWAVRPLFDFARPNPLLTYF